MSDLVLYPIRGQVSQVIGKSEYIVYVPRATKYTYGTVKIGKGLIDEEGVISVDLSNVKIDSVSLNGSPVAPDDNKNVNIVIDASTVGLDKVNNTADKDKPVSTATEQAIATAKTELMDDVMNVQEDLDDHKTSVDDRLLVINETIKTNKSSVESEVIRLENLIKGMNQAVAYANYREVVSKFNMAATNAYSVGQPVFVQKIDVPDLWVYSKENTHVDYTYTTDDDLINVISDDGYVQIGYFKLAMMETKTTTVSNAVTLDTVQTVTGTKIFVNQIGILNGAEGEINYLKHINNNFLISSSDGENIINIDEQLRRINFYNKPLALEEYVGNNFISYTTNQNLSEAQKEIARNNIGAGTGSGGTVSVSYATTDEAGIILIATDSDIEAGVDTTKAVTPAQLNAVVGGVENWLVELNTGAGV